MLKEVPADGVRALVISQVGEKRVVRLAGPLLHQPLRAGGLAAARVLAGGTCTSGSQGAEWKSSSLKESGTN